jgi:hypothetical protein
MADNQGTRRTKPEGQNIPDFKLDPALRQRLTDLSPSIEKAKHGMDVMKKLGMDVRSIEDKIQWAEKVRKTLLESYK